ncbi:hypothetical protein phiA034_gene0039 [Aeromonas phage phiA034]|uniref:Uncharacterized protein n=1 Tax=Aeromonas phage phiA034 TaxID=2985287 RepID=A0AAE9YH91_9CAUD|nr:hypothetical protein pAEv1812_50 [Aeromonas phage pAEv1812]WCZ66122.1 hypothetical protein phiA034_gene0039 [Aeromonas phage phiA034]
MNNKYLASQDDAAIDEYAAALKAKMAAGRLKGRGGWYDQDSATEDNIITLFARCLDKSNEGNLLDLGLLIMMLHVRGADPAHLADAIKHRDRLLGAEVKGKVQDLIAELEKDTRLHYRAANVFSNAPLAMIQANLTSQLDVLYTLLGARRPEYPCDKE